MSLLATRIISLVLMLLGTFLCGVLPIFLRRCTKPCTCERNSKCSCGRRRFNLIISFLIYFGGGVLLATCFMHLMPEAREGFENVESLQEENTTERDRPNTVEHKDAFPLLEFIVCCGFFAVYLVEEALHSILRYSQVTAGEEEKSSQHPSNVSFASSPTEEEDEEDWAGLYKADPPDYGTIRKTLDGKEKARSKKTIKSHFTLSGLLTVAALSFHSVFDGFALGLQKTETETWTLFFALAVHKFVIAFVIGLEEIMLNGREVLVIVYIAVFSVVSPLGGMAAILTDMSISDPSRTVSGVLQAIATGTLLYVTFFEILKKDNSKEHSGFAQLLATFLGFAGMTSIHFVLTIVG